MIKNFVGSVMDCMPREFSTPAGKEVARICWRHRWALLCSCAAVFISVVAIKILINQNDAEKA